MIRRKLCGLFSLLLILSILAVGCGDPGTAPTQASTDPPITANDLVYEKDVRSFGEKYGNAYDRKRSLRTSYNGIVYHFDYDISVEERFDLIMECDKLIRVLLENHPGYSEVTTVCFRPDDYTARSVDHTLYIGTEKIKTQEFAIGMAMAVFGHDVNYGLIYAHGLHAAKRLGYPTETVSEDLVSAIALYDSTPEYLDMSYPCFLDDYADDKTIGYVKTLATQFHQYLLDQKLYDLLSDYSDKKYCTYLSQFLGQHGKGSYDNTELGGTIFYYGGPVIRLIWENEDAVFYVEDTYRTQYESAYFDADMLNSGYANLRRVVIDYQLQADFIEKRLEKYESENGKVDVLFSTEHSSDKYSLANYTHGANLIRMFCVSPFIHEYGHYLLRDTGIESWMNELICYYYGYNPVDEQITYMWSHETERIQDVVRKHPETSNEAVFITIMLDYLKRDIDWSNPEDFSYIFSGYLIAAKSFDQLTDPNAGSHSKHSFLTYLFNIAGETATLDAIINNTPVETFGASWEQLIENWENHIHTSYAWLKTYYK